MVAPIAFEMSELQSAAQLVYRVMPATPLYAWPKLKRRLGCSVHVKHENHTPTGAFKVRGGIVYLDRLCRAQPYIRGVISATRGNHGQSIAFAAGRAGVPATIYVPTGNSPDQNSAILGFGARVVEFGRDFDEAKHEAFKTAAAESLHFIPSFHRDLDALYVGMGMGSGLCGAIAVRDLLGLKTEIVGVSAAKAPANALSFAAGAVVPSPSSNTFADGLATREPHADAIAAICRGASRWVEVSEDEIAAAMRIYFDDAHQVAEGAGAAPLAALLKDRERMAGKNVAVVLSGGNIERARFLTVLAGETPAVG